MSNQPPPPSRPWLRFASPAVPPAPQPPPPATMPMPPPVGPPPPEPTPPPPSPTPEPSTLPGTTPAPEPQPLPPVPVPQLPAPPPVASIPLPPPIPVVETLAPPTSTIFAPPTATTASPLPHPPPTVSPPKHPTGTGNGIIAKKKVGVKVIIIAGENEGATMELASSAKNRCYKIGNNANGGGGGSDKGKHRREDKGRNSKAPATASLPTAMYANSNVQGVNNSILHNSSCTNHNPGVHFSLTRKPADGVITPMKEHQAA